MGFVHLGERGNGGHGIPAYVEPPGVVALGVPSLPPGPVAQDREGALKLSHLGVGKLAVLHVVFLLAVALAPGVAHAETFILSASATEFNGATQVALYYLGYDVRPGGESGLSDQAISALFGDEYTDFLFFKDSLYRNVLTLNNWVSSLDGFAFAFAVDAARADVEQAAKDYPIKQTVGNPEIQDGTIPQPITLNPIVGKTWVGSLGNATYVDVNERQIQPLTISQSQISKLNSKIAATNAKYWAIIGVTAGVWWKDYIANATRRYVIGWLVLSSNPISISYEINNSETENEFATYKVIIKSQGQFWITRNDYAIFSGTEVYEQQTEIQNIRTDYMYSYNDETIRSTYVDTTGSRKIYGLYSSITSEIIEPDPDPEPPTQPDVPTPDPPTLPDPPTTDPQPPTTDPQPPVTVYPPITWVQQPTGTDIIPYLAHIIDDIQALDTHIEEHCLHLRQALHDQVGWLADTLTDYIEWAVDEITEAIKRNIDQIQNQISAENDSWYNWYARLIHDQLGWQAEYLVSALRVEFDRLSTILDDSVTRPINTWLRMIYGKMGGNGGAKPSPTTEPDSWLDWLHSVIDALLDMLDALVPSFGGALEQLKDIFPFSIPWDIAFCLGLLAQEPQTPVFDVPYPYGYRSGALVYASVRVDFTPWNGVALIIRRIMTVLFAYMLAWATPRLYNGINTTGKE